MYMMWSIKVYLALFEATILVVVVLTFLHSYICILAILALLCLDFFLACFLAGLMFSCFLSFLFLACLLSCWSVFLFAWLPLCLFAFSLACCFAYLQDVPQYCLHFCFVNFSASKAPRYSILGIFQQPFTFQNYQICYYLVQFWPTYFQNTKRKSLWKLTFFIYNWIKNLNTSDHSGILRSTNEPL